MSIIWLLLFAMFLFSGFYKICKSSYTYDCSGSISKKCYFSNKRMLILIGLVISFSMLAATRNDFFDSGSYKLLFDQCKNTGFIDCLNIPNYEKGFVILTKLITYISNDYRFYFFIIPVFNILIIMFSLKKLRVGYLKGIIVYISTIGIYYNFIVLRQGLAISLLFLAYSFFKEKNYIISVCICILAYYFHMSTLFVIILLGICTLIKENRHFLIYISALSILFYLIGNMAGVLPYILKYVVSLLPQSMSKYAFYTDVIQYDTSISIIYLFVLVYNLYYLLFNKKFNLKIAKYIIGSYLFFSIFAIWPVTVRFIHFSNLFYILEFNEEQKNKRLCFFVFNILHIIFYIRFILLETSLF